MAMGLPNLGILPPNPAAASEKSTAESLDFDGGTSISVEDPSKKIRKPYTITKSRQSWTEPEHDKFLEALQLFDRDWKKIEAFIGSKTVIQIRSHAQKYFVKVQKSGTNEHLPPPRPKRKAAHPYPQKASKSVAAPELKQGASIQASPALSEPGFIQKADTSSTARPAVSGASMPCRSDNSVEAASLLRVKEGNKRSSEEQGVGDFSCCGDDDMRKTPPIGQMPQLNNIPSLRVLPDFAQVYSFIGSIFDPNASGHLQKLKKMDCIDVETVLLLMRNLSINLSSPDFEEHRKLLSSYEIDVDKDDIKVGGNAIRDVLSENA